jgi:hypothetical protein
MFMQQIADYPFSGIKRPECESDHGLPSTAGVKKAWNYTPIFLYAFVASCVIKHAPNFTFCHFFMSVTLTLTPYVESVHIWPSCLPGIDMGVSHLCSVMKLDRDGFIRLGLYTSSFLYDCIALLPLLY